MKCPLWLYKRIDRRGRIPLWVRWLWRKAHWCCAMDGLLIIDNQEDCFCGLCPDKVDINYIAEPKYGMSPEEWALWEGLEDDDR